MFIYVFLTSTQKGQSGSENEQNVLLLHIEEENDMYFLNF